MIRLRFFARCGVMIARQAFADKCYIAERIIASAAISGYNKAYQTISVQ